MPPKKDLTITAETKAQIHDILQSRFGRQVESVTLQPGSNNTQVYTVAIAPGANVDANKTNTHVTRRAGSAQSAHAPQPGTEALPADTTTVILRFTDTGADLNDAVQVQNEVVAYSLARVALASLDAPVTPRIYGWHAVDMDTKAPGWILQELMRGTGLNDEVLGKLDRAAKDSVLADIARILHLLQQYKLPASVVGYGGLNFDDDGQAVTGPTAIHGATKACATYHELYNECVPCIRTSNRKQEETPSLTHTDTCKHSFGEWMCVTSSRVGRIHRICVPASIPLLNGASSRCSNVPSRRTHAPCLFTAI